MPASRRSRLATAAAVAVALVLTGGCSGRSDDAGAAAETPHRGGTLVLLAESGGGESKGFEHLDPQRTYVVTALNVTRLIYRTLTTFRSGPGQNGSDIVPDLATDLGRPSQGNKIWEFTLKPNLKWEDGQPITCQQVKYGTERSFSSLISGGPSYPKDYLVDAANYQGPYVGGNNGGQGLSSITCVDNRTIRFRLNQPIGDFGYTVSLPVFSPVRPEKDTKERYDDHPLANGPYKIERYDQKELVLVRNQFWDPRTDPVRRAYPDRVEVRFGVDAGESTNALVLDQPEYRDAVQLDINVPANFVQQVVNDAELRKRAVDDTNGFVRYLAINTRTVSNLQCRQALEYALNRRKFRAVLGGSIFGDYASTMIAPGQRAHKDFDLYHARTEPDGNLELARKVLSGTNECPSRLTLDYQQTLQRAAMTIVESYQQLGIEVVPHPIPRGDFYNEVGVPDKQHDLVLAAWSADWPNGSAVLPPLFDGRLIDQNSQGGNYNFSQLNDPTVNKLIDQAKAESDLSRQYQLWGELDYRLAQLAVTVPLTYDRALQMYGSRVRGALLHPSYGEPDAIALGLG